MVQNRTEVTEVTVRTEVRIQEVARTDFRGGSYDSVALSSAQNRCQWIRGPQSNQTEANGYLSPPMCETPVVVLTKHNFI